MAIGPEANGRTRRGSVHGVLSRTTVRGTRADHDGGGGDGGGPIEPRLTIRSHGGAIAPFERTDTTVADLVQLICDLAGERDVEARIHADAFEQLVLAMDGEAVGIGLERADGSLRFVFDGSDGTRPPARAAAAVVEAWAYDHAQALGRWEST